MQPPPDATEEDGLPDESGPERTCIVTRQKGGKDTLIRFVLSPDKAVVPDIRAKLPGRGAWVLADRATLLLAMKRRSFTRAFKADVVVPADLPGLVEGLIEADALQTLAFANKAGLVTSGAMKVEKMLAEKPVIGLLHAKEAGHDGIRKIEAAARRRFGEGASRLRRIQIFSADQLDLALGRTHVIHAALTAGAVSEGFITRSERLERFRGLVPLSAVGDERDAAERRDGTTSRDDEIDAAGRQMGSGPRDGITDE